ncbi:DUF2812 domain-containing protein [Clostridium hydrogenum]|uniref:DUF2812 domain-containing protein n=1 Tax=Clostridium hydrogenum TaxID=2855764 RepID=UPI001F3EA1DF|nr:DUF2812 domain-containing protein [Clostridium hydrogenum]
MKNKYVMVRGFAFSESSDMEKLRDYAKEGWILEGISGLFYKLRKGEAQDIQYSLDYQEEATKEYFDLFTEAGWTHVVSSGNLMHIFSAPVGTKPIYTECASEMDKYSSIRNQMKRGSIYFAIALITLAVLSVVSEVFIKPIFIPIFLLFILSIFPFTFTFMPYLAYGSRIKKIRKNGKGNSDVTFKFWLIWLIVSLLFLFEGIYGLTRKWYVFAVCFILLGMIYIYLSISDYKKRK